jgi:hypothetical protein
MVVESQFMELRVTIFGTEEKGSVDEVGAGC